MSRLLAELGKPHDSNAKNTASDGLKKLQQLSVRSQDGIVLPGGGSSPSSTGSDPELARDVEFNKNSHLTASSKCSRQHEATHYSLGAVAALLSSYLQSGIARSKDRNLAQRGVIREQSGDDQNAKVSAKVLPLTSLVWTKWHHDEKHLTEAAGIL
ncbi:hypothetical protein Pst134EB_028477 [Puccinia striiformis f. sp. tritici]|nr:hypothetical protein Pst134EB_028477 [Puccinia striiformis f. sp. tritici]